MRLDIEADPRLLGGKIQPVGAWAGVLYNADGVNTEAIATPLNTTVAVITRNRVSYLKDLLDSIDSSLPKEVQRLVLVNNSEDQTVEVLQNSFPHWAIDVVIEQDFGPISPGLQWLRSHRPHLLPPSLRDGQPSGYGPTNSIAWLRNRMLLKCGTRFLISFDDDMLVRPGWWEYLLTYQNRYYVSAVINNFAAFLIDTHVTKKIGWFDERYLRSHGYEDNDYLTRINEAKLRWVLGFNQDHDWRSAEEGNPRGSGTGSNLFIHRYAKSTGGFSASNIENTNASTDKEYYSNGHWHHAKWRHIKDPTGLMDRPPFKGYFLQRIEMEEPNWYPQSKEIAHLVPTNAGRKITQNTPVSQIDVFERPATSTMIDRYTFLSHWCKDKDVLDAGCGHGYGTALLHALGCKSILGFDVDADAISGAKKNYQRLNLRFTVGDLFHLPRDLCRNYDIVTCVEVFEHIRREHIPAFATGLRSTLRDGGTVIFTTPRRKTKLWDNDGGTHLYEYSCEEFISTLQPLFRDSQIQFYGIREFQVRDSPQWFSQWIHPLDDSATVMVAVATNIPSLPVDCVSSVQQPETSNTPIQLQEELPKLSLLLSNRNTLPYLKLAIKSCREYLLRPDHEIVVYDDGSSDGSLEWLESVSKRFRLKILSSPGPDRKGIVYVYDELVRAASNSTILIMHSDMFFSRQADAEIWRHYGPNTVATCTRVEPPLHQEEPFRILKDFGVDAPTFKEEEFLRYAEAQKNPQKTTQGIFAPILMQREAYLALGGHDKAFAPQSREDSDFFNRMHLAGMRFVQSWSSFCYHFSGRGSRRKDAPHEDSWEWKLSNSKNERNFIRKWGTSVRHDRWLKPMVRAKRCVSLVGLLGDELEHVIPWLTHLEPYFDDIVLVDDSSDGSAKTAMDFIIREAAQSPLVEERKLRIIQHALNNDFSSARNVGHREAQFDWVFHLDLDERLPISFLERIQDIVDNLEREGKTVCGFPRLNTLDGTIVNDVPRSEWNADALRTLAEREKQDAIAIRNPDLQFRLMRRDVSWTNKVHEVPSLVQQGHAHHNQSLVAIFQHEWIRHDKSLLRQALQDARYQKEFGAFGPHSQWNPAQIATALTGDACQGLKLARAVNINTKEYWDQLANKEMGASSEFKDKEIVKWLLKEAEKLQLVRILEIGCARGAMCTALADELRARSIAFELTGIDLSELMIQWAKEHCDPGIKFLSGDINSLIDELGMFDFLISNHTLEHLSELGMLIQKFSNHGKMLFFEAPYANHIDSPEHVNQFDESFMKPHQKYFQVIDRDGRGWVVLAMGIDLEAVKCERQYRQR